MSEPNSPRLTGAGKIFVLLFVAGCLYGAYILFRGRDGKPGPTPTAATQARPSSGSKVRIGIAYGTEKERWLQGAAAEFAKTEEGKDIEIDLIPMGSLEGAQAVLRSDERIQVWSPASALYKDVFLQEWQVQHSGGSIGGGASPIAREENLALTPMVFVMWAERYEAFRRKYGEVSFRTLGQALAEPSGWQTIAQKPEWGLFKLGHTHPNQSNSGLMTLVLMAYDYHQKSRGLSLQDILDPGFVTWLRELERGVSGLSNSTGNLMREMVLKGPSSYDAVVVYESVAIDYLKNAEGRWGELRIVYPERNAWNENPYYVLDVPWSSPEQREAAGRFLDFLLTEPVQKQSLVHGFRPGNPAVPVRFQGSPFVSYERFGLSVDLGTACEMPRAEILNNLLAGWERARGGP
ncbi:MAG TPA: substrate-binding domain-containing protein [Thermoanaerobaculia bacterium]|jgi:ABC-type Fe3+ transport system substrate-binding protein|nr:substrate-binding domain-containing protein [Thermoanaerobaculia bacterium]